MGVEEDYMWVTGNAFSEMRLLIEGAITLYENDAGDLCGLTIKADMPKARYALNDIGTALYELRRHIEALENEHRLEDLRQRKPREQKQTSAFNDSKTAVRTLHNSLKMCQRNRSTKRFEAR